MSANVCTSYPYTDLKQASNRPPVEHQDTAAEHRAKTGLVHELSSVAYTVS